MEEIKLPGGTVHIYKSIKELPIRLSKEFQKHLLQDIGIGNTLQDIDDHLEKLFVHAQRSDWKSVMEETKNMRFNFFSMLSGLDFKSSAFCCLVHSINGERILDYSAEGLTRIADTLSDMGLTGEIAETQLDEVKKNLIPNANYIFRNSSQMM
jgi:hypothetical protein